MPGVHLSQAEKNLARWWDNASLPFPSLRSIALNGRPGLRGIEECRIEFQSPISVVCGRNGSGKTTLLTLSALGFHGDEQVFPRGARNQKFYTFRDFFFKGPDDPNITGLVLTWGYKGAPDLTIQKQSQKWMKYARRPKRPVHYFGTGRIVPAIEATGYCSTFRGDIGKKSDLNEDYRKRLGHILSRSYSQAGVREVLNRRTRRCTSGGTYSSFNMGSGEDALIELLFMWQTSPKGTLFVIEEIELGLHPEAQRRLCEEMVKVANNHHYQIICSSHSEAIIDALPRNSRILVERMGSVLKVTPGPTTRLALSSVSGENHHECVIYCEDEAAAGIITASLDMATRRRILVKSVGSKVEVARICKDHARVGASHASCMAVFDGEVSDSEFTSLSSDIHSVRLPGGKPPERWIIAQCRVPDRMDRVASEFNCTSEEAGQVVSSLEAERDHHAIFYRAAQLTGTTEDEAAAALIRVAVHANIALDELRTSVQRRLNGEQAMVAAAATAR